MDTGKRLLERGRQMRLHVGDKGPLPAVQSFECTGNLDITRNNEYDSDEQILTLGIATFSGNFEVLDCERSDVYQGLMGRSSSTLTDVVIDNFGSAPIMLNVWNRQKTRFVKSYLVIGPTYSSDPFPTTVGGVTSMRFEFQATKGVRFPQHACAFVRQAIGASPSAGTAYGYGGVTPVKLSRKFGGQYVACVVNKVPDVTNSNDFDYSYMCVASSTTSSFILTEAPAPNSEIFAYFAYVSTAEAGGYICSTL